MRTSRSRCAIPATLRSSRTYQLTAAARPRAGARRRAARPRGRARPRDRRRASRRPAAARAFSAYLSSLVHDVSLFQGVLEHLGEPWCERADDGAWWDDGRGVSLSAALPGGGRAHLVHHHVPGVNDYAQRLTLHCSDRVLELTFPSPYLLHLPTRLVEIRSDGALGLRTHRPPRLLRGGVPRGVARVLRRLRGRAPRVTPAEAGRADIALLLDAYRHARCARDRGVCCPLTRRNRRWSSTGHASAAARSRA